MKNLEKQVNKTFNKAVYLQLMGAFDPLSDWRKTKEIVLSTHLFFKKSSEEEIGEKINEIDARLTEMVDLYLKRFPQKKDINSIADSWNECFKNGHDPYQYGVTYGWLNNLMDLRELNLYKDVPYHYKIGLGAHKGFGGVEEDFLFKDAFHGLLKSEKYYELLLLYGEKEKIEHIKDEKKEFDKHIYKNITDIKYEISAYARLGIISFYAFVESFVNSVGYSFSKNNEDVLSSSEQEVLNGFKKGRHLSLRQKIEQYQKIIRPDGKIGFITTDVVQMPPLVKDFFSEYEGLRNSSVHFSPTKESIWLKPEDWVEKVRTFSKLSVKLSLEFWLICFDANEGPHYLNKLDYNDLYTRAKTRLENISEITHDLKKEEYP